MGTRGPEEAEESNKAGHAHGDVSREVQKGYRAIAAWLNGLAQDRSAIGERICARMSDPQNKGHERMQRMGRH